MHVYPAKSSAHQAPTFDKAQHFPVFSDGNRWQCTHEFDHFGSFNEIAAGKLADHKRMSESLAVLE